MERLTDKKLKAACGYFVNFASKEEAVKYRLLAESAPKYEEIYKKLADYEDKQKQGLLIELPCKVGDTVYALTPFCEICEEDLDYGYTCEICSKGNFVSETKFDYEMIPMFGKAVFLTRSEAESALAKMGGK